MLFSPGASRLAPIAEERLERRCVGGRFQHMVLAGQGEIAGIGQRFGQRPVAVAHPERALAAIAHQHRHAQRGPAGGIERLALLIAGDDVAVTGQRMRHRLQFPPDRRQPHQRDQQAGHADRFEEGGDGVAAPVFRDGLPDRGPVGLRGRAAAVHDQRRLVEREPGDAGQAACCHQRQHGAGRHAPDTGLAAGRAEHGLDVVDLALDRVGKGIAAAATAAPVVAKDGEVACQRLGQRAARAHGARTERAVDEDQRMAPAALLAGNRRSVARRNRPRGRHLSGHGLRSSRSVAPAGRNSASSRRARRAPAGARGRRRWRRSPRNGHGCARLPG